MVLQQAITSLRNASRLNSSIVGAIKIRETFYAIPFEVTSGVNDRTEAGYTGIGSKPQDFTSYVRIISGTEAFTIQ